MESPKVYVRDYMHPATYSFNHDTSVEEVVKTLTKNHIVGAPVLDADGKLIGFITEQNCIKQMLNNTYYNDSHEVAADIMRKDPLSVSAEEDILNLAEKMSTKGPKIYPVVENDKVIGIIRRADVLKALSLVKSNSRSVM
jgi:predicted transcriptional regulator